jgi:hypothetical protein
MKIKEDLKAEKSENKLSSSVNYFFSVHKKVHKLAIAGFT